PAIPDMSEHIASFSADFALIENGLVSLGPTSFADTSIANTLSVGNSLSISNNAINTFGSDLDINPLGQGGVSFLAGKVRIAPDGTVSVSENADFAKNVTVHGQLATNI